MLTHWQSIGTFLIGAVVGLLGGLFGKGGSAVATPLLQLLGLPSFIAVASPLPATAPSTMIAAFAYTRSGNIDWKIVRWGIFYGIPATLLGAWLSRYTGGWILLLITALLVLGFGLSFLFRPTELPSSNHDPRSVAPHTSFSQLHLALISIAVGLVSGLLANSGGFLLAPLYARVLKMPLKVAFACSLAVSAVLALPGTIVHWYLGHISWTVTLLVGLGSIPCSYLGARIAIRTSASRLERFYGIALLIIGFFALYDLRPSHRPPSPPQATHQATTDQGRS